MYACIGGLVDEASFRRSGISLFVVAMVMHLLHFQPIISIILRGDTCVFVSLMDCGGIFACGCGRIIRPMLASGVNLVKPHILDTVFEHQQNDSLNLSILI